MSKPITIVAFDPGLTGAFAFYCPDAPEIITVYDMPVAGKRVDPAAISRRLEQIRPDVAMVEQVNAMPSIPDKNGKRRGMGATSAFNFGDGYGAIRGVLASLKIPTHFVPPATWKRRYSLPGGKPGKIKARALACQLWPASGAFERGKDEGRAEAALLARYAAETLGSHQVGNVVASPTHQERAA